ncbi:MAG: hypothetical protein ABIG30_02550, partial [Candidatus Aenigmatarchaeota archaeon]
MKLNYRYIVIFIVAIITLWLLKAPFDNSYAISQQSGTVLNDNWWNALNWIKNNTASCSVVATYWDPGHFITGIANRAVVFDGTSQGAFRTITDANGNETVYSRIQDIATVLYTDDEDLAVEILERYKFENCSDPLYFIASADLLSKAVWWTYFATWEPVTKGKMMSYAIVYLTETKPLLAENAISYTYDVGDGRSFVIYDRNDTLQPFFVQQNTFLKVEKVFAVDSKGKSYFLQTPDAEIKGTIWVSFDKQTAIFIPPELENSMFTRMFLFNGYG